MEQERVVERTAMTGNSVTVQVASISESVVLQRPEEHIVGNDAGIDRQEIIKEGVVSALVQEEERGAMDVSMQELQQEDEAIVDVPVHARKESKKDETQQLQEQLLLAPNAFMEAKMQDEMKIWNGVEDLKERGDQDDDMVHNRYHARQGRMKRRLQKVKEYEEEHVSLKSGLSSLEATIAVGLKPGVLTLLPEKKKYGGNRNEYLEARDHIVRLWYSNRLYFLTEEACVESAPEEMGADVVRDVYQFLSKQGCINFGILRNDPFVPVPAKVFANAARGTELEPTDEAIASALYILLEKINMDDTSEKMIRNILGEHFGAAMKPRKGLIRDLIATYLGNGGPPADFVKQRKKGEVVVIGAGPSGLTAALHLKRHGYKVTVLEARDRVGGRINSHNAVGFGAPIDLGASIITGTVPDLKKGLRADPSSILCHQLGISLHELRSDLLPLHDAEKKCLVDQKMDRVVEKVRDELMDRAAAYLEDLPEEKQTEASFGTLLNQAMEKWTEETRKMIEEEATENLTQIGGLGQALSIELRVEQENGKDAKIVLDIKPSNPAMANKISGFEDTERDPKQFPEQLTGEHMRLLGWHWANLEYGCSAPLDYLSAAHWNQDEDFGGFGGPHCFVIGGYDQPFKILSDLLDVRFECPVAQIDVLEGTSNRNVIVETEEGQTFACDAVIVTVPLGVLKQETIQFRPELPQWKKDAIERLGFGKLNKVFLQFEECFWDDSVDFFGAAKGTLGSNRGLCFMFWNIHRFSGTPILAALVSGHSAHESEVTDPKVLESIAFETLQSVYPDREIPSPVASFVTKWGTDQYAGGSYSFVAVGASGEDYDLLARPVGRKIFFAGEHTCREHPDTVGGAMLTGLREAARIIEVLEDGGHEHRAKTISRKIDLDGVEDNERRELDIEEKAMRAMGNDIARMEEQMMSRHASRAVAKDMWKALLEAEGGDVRGVLECLQTANSVALQLTIAKCLEEANKMALKNVLEDQDCFSILVDWLDDVALAQKWSHLVEALLKSFTTAPWQSMNVLEGKNRLILAARKISTQHVDDSIKLVAKHLIPAITGDAPYDSDDYFFSPLQKRFKPLEKVVEITVDERTKEELAAAEAEVRALEDEAERLRAEAEAFQSQTQETDEGMDAAVFSNFEEYLDNVRKNRKKPKTKVDRLSVTNGDQGMAGLRRRVDGLISEQLKPYYSARKINKDSYKAILKKAGDKVMSKATERDYQDMKRFLKDRHNSIKHLVKEYVSTYAHRERKNA